MDCEYLKFSSKDSSGIDESVKRVLEKEGYLPFVMLHAPDSFLFGPLKFDEETGTYCPLTEGIVQLLYFPKEKIIEGFQAYEEEGLVKEVIGTVGLTDGQINFINRFGKTYMGSRKSLIETIKEYRLR